MSTVLVNLLRFTALVVGVPQVQAHGLNDKGLALAPNVVLANTGPFTIAVDATNVTVTLTAASPGDAVNVYVQLTHSIQTAYPAPGTLPAGFPFVLQPDGSGGPPSGPAGGDLDGAYPDPTIHRPRQVFVYDQGGVDGANVYTDWATLITAMAAVSGLKTIELRNTGGGPATIPAGVYDMTDVSWRGALPNPLFGTGTTQLLINADGTIFNNLGLIEDLRVENDVGLTDPPINVAEGQTLIVLRSFLIGNFPGLIRLNQDSGPAGATSLLLHETFVGSGGETIENVAGAGAPTRIILGEMTEFSTSKLSGNGAVTFVIGAASSILADQSGTFGAGVLAVENRIQPRWTTVATAAAVFAAEVGRIYVVDTTAAPAAALVESIPENRGLDVVVRNNAGPNDVTVTPVAGTTLSGVATVGPGGVRRYADIGTGEIIEIT